MKASLNIDNYLRIDKESIYADPSFYTPSILADNQCWPAECSLKIRGTQTVKRGNSRYSHFNSPEGRGQLTRIMVWYPDLFSGEVQ